MMVFGIDPGLEGGLAAFNVERIKLAIVERMPTLASGKGSGWILDEYGIRNWFSLKVGVRSHAFIERAFPMPKQGVTSVFTFGMGWGIIRGILVGLEVPHTVVSPKDWQREMLRGVPKGDTKAASIIVAKRLFPQLAGWIGRHHGMSDALLIAEYGRRQLRK